MTAYALKNADPKYKAFDEEDWRAHKERRNINIKQCRAMRKINNMMHALDVVREKSYDFEDISQARLTQGRTTSDGEGWFWTYHNAGEEIEKCMIAQCIKVANMAANYDATGLTHRGSASKAGQTRSNCKKAEFTHGPDEEH